MNAEVRIRRFFAARFRRLRYFSSTRKTTKAVLGLSDFGMTMDGE